MGPRSVLRVLDMLQAVAAHPDGLTLTEISSALALPKTSTFTLLKALEAGDYLDLRNSRYVLGLQALRLGVSLNQPHLITRYARPVLEWLAQETNETIMLAVPAEEGHEVIYLDVIESDTPLRFVVRPGNRRPFYCAAAGKAVLAFLSIEFQQKYLDTTTFIKFTADTSSKEELIKLLPKIRRRGVVLDANGIIDGAAGVASPGFDRNGRVNCAISIAGPTARMLAQQAQFERLALEAGERMSRLMGYAGRYPAAWPA